MDSPGQDRSEVYYGVFVPNGPSTTDIQGRVCTDKEEALKLLKGNKKARFKAFAGEKDAVQFARRGLEVKSDAPVSPSPEVLAFKGPKTQELLKFRQCIEKHDAASVVKYIDDNPRFLISSGDTPCILQEGARYNVLHICARASAATICSLVLDRISNVEFMRRVYGSNGDLEERCEILLDLYLNTPDKGANDTPLHCAAKIGAVDVVKVLLSYKQCDRSRVNKCGQTAAEVVCSRASGPAKANKDEILAALEPKFYIPVLRSPDMPPSIGKPFSSTSPSSEVVFPPSSDNRFTSPLSITAVAGPLKETEAAEFHKLWKTPPRNPARPSFLSRTDPERGLERVGRRLAFENKIPFIQYWPFLNAYVDLASAQGLRMLENYIRSEINSQLHSESPPAASPISELCNAFKSLNIGDGRTVSSANIDKWCLVFATRIVSSLRSPSAVHAELSRFQNFLSSCSSDAKFSPSDLYKTHSRLAANIQSKLRDGDKELINNFMERYGQHSWVRCIFTFLERADSRTEAVECNCVIPVARRPRKLAFEDETELKPESQELFFTPPSSPTPESEDFFDLGEIPVVFLDGDEPSRVDALVLETIESVPIDPYEFPFIDYWKKLCSSRNTTPSSVLPLRRPLPQSSPSLSHVPTKHHAVFTIFNNSQ